MANAATTTAGLVLEGGAMRGLFSAGVTDVLMEEGISFPAIAAVSAGATFGCNYPSHQPGRALRYNLAFHDDGRYGTMKSFLRTGDLYDVQLCYRDIPLTLDPFDFETFTAAPTDFWVVCTDADTAMPVYHLCADDPTTCLDWIRASASMPIVSRPVEIDGKRLLDGGIADPIPLRFLEGRGYERNVIVLTQPRSYVKEPASPAMRPLLRSLPAIARAMTVRHRLYNDTRTYLFAREKAGAAFIICPDEPLPVSRTDHDLTRLQATYDHGRAVAERALPALRAFLG